MKTNFTNFWVIIFLSFFSSGQGDEIDSLKNKLKGTEDYSSKISILLQLSRKEEDSLLINQYIEDAKGIVYHVKVDERPELLFRIAYNYYQLNFLDSALTIAQLTSESFKLLKDLKKDGESERLLGKIYQRNAQFDKAIASYKLAVESFSKSNEIRRQIDCLNSMGVIHKNLNNFSEALPLYHKAYELSRKSDLKIRLAATSTNIGVLLKNQGKFKEAINYYKKAEEVYLLKNDYGGLANVYNNLGNVYRLQKNYSSALNNYYLAIENRNNQGDSKRMSYTYNNIAIVYQEKENYQKAIEYLKLSQELKIENNEQESLSSTHLNFAEIYLNLNNQDKFYFHVNEARKIASEYNQSSIRRSVILLMSEFSANQKDYKAAYIYLSSVYDELDTLNLEEQDVLTSVLQAQFERDQSKNEIHELSDAIILLDLQKDELERKQATSRMLIIGLGFLVLGLVVLSVLFYKKQHTLKLRTDELAVANNQLRASTVSIEEKELLLKEIHHRVKNNLQIIKSLVRLQNTGDSGTEIYTLLQDFELRVSSMALVHESLYKSGDLAKIDVPNYYNELLDNLVAVYNLHQKVETNISIKINELGIDTLVPLGLVSTEIVSNSLKYGVAPESHVLITVSLEQIKKNEYELYIGDNGKGFNMTEVKTKNTLGVELIHTLVEQLDGDISFSNENGAHYKIRFKSQDK